MAGDKPVFLLRGLRQAPPAKLSAGLSVAGGANAAAIAENRLESGGGLRPEPVPGLLPAGAGG